MPVHMFCWRKDDHFEQSLKKGKKKNQLCKSNQTEEYYFVTEYQHLKSIVNGMPIIYEAWCFIKGIKKSKKHSCHSTCHLKNSSS